jgi:DHA2 family methylenomycin A resistance protein-like MFS transporter
MVAWAAQEVRQERFGDHQLPLLLDQLGLAGLPGHRSGIASATVNAARQTGTALGVAALGALLARGSTLPSGLHAAMGVAGVVLLAVTVLTAVTLRRAG